MRILVVEDDESSNMALMRVLEADHEVYATREAESASLMLESQRFDLVLMDIGLPGMTGLELTTLMRSGSMNRTTPVVAVSGLEGAEVVDEAIRTGFCAFVRKPYTVRSLQEIVEVYAGDGSVSVQALFRVFE